MGTRSTTPTTTIPEFEPHCITLSGTWGEPLVCPENHITVGICGSGGNKACTNTNNKPVVHEIRCCLAKTQPHNNLPPTNPSEPIAINSQCGWSTHEAGALDTLSSCPTNYLTVGRCDSGANADCSQIELMTFGSNLNYGGSWSGDFNNNHAAFCCRAFGMEDGNTYWDKCDFGEDCMCPDGYVVTDTCGSGWTAACQAVGPQTWDFIGVHGTAIRCTRWVAAEGIQTDFDGHDGWEILT